MGLTIVSIRRPVFITMFVLALIVLGIRGRMDMPVELMPKTDLPYVMVRTIYAGAGPNEVETLVSKPIEKAVSSVNGIKNVTSTSREGVSMVNIEFEFGTDTATAAADVRDKVSGVRRFLPDDIEEPSISKLDMSSQPILILGMTGNIPLKEMKDYADETISERFSKINGVAAVNVFGGDEREINVAVDKDRLQAYGIPITKIVEVISTANLNVPAGTIKETKSEYSVRTVGEYSKVEEIENIRFMVNGQVIRLGDIATVKDGIAEPTVIAEMNGKPTVIFAIQKQSDANIVEVSNNLKKELEAVREFLPEGVSVDIMRDTSEYSQRALDGVNNSLLEGIILVVIIVFVFLHSIRATFIVAIAIPTSLFATFLPISAFGFTLNQMTLLGLSLVIGILVDDSIVVLENIERHLKMRKNPVQAAIDGRSEIGLAAITITSVDMVVFLPIAFMQGIVGQVFRQFGVTVAIATGFSLLMAFTLTPMLASRWMKSEEENERDMNTMKRRFREKKATFTDWTDHIVNLVFGRFDKWLAKLDSGYRKLLEWALDNRYLTIVIGIVSLLAVLAMVMPLKGPGRTVIALLTLALCAISLFVNKNSKLVALSFGAAFIVITLFIKFPFGFNFLPTTDEGLFNISLMAPPGTSLEEMSRITDQVVAVVAEVPEIKNGGFYGGVVGVSAAAMGGSSGSNYGTVMVTAVKKSERERSLDDIMEEITNKTADIAGLQLLATSAQSSIGGGIGGAWDIVMEVQGVKFDDVVAQSNKVAEIMRKNSDIADVDISYKPIQPERRIVIDKTKVAQFDTTVAKIANALRVGIEGDYSSKFREDGIEYDIRVQFEKDQRKNITELQDMIVGTYKGSPIYLRDIANIVADNSPTEITRKNRQRVIYVYANLARGAALGNVQNQILDDVKANRPISGITVMPGGMGDIMTESFGYMVAALILAIALVYMLMGALFESFLTPFVILFSLPMAIVGALLALFLTGKTLSIVAMIGIIMLMGLVTKNAILLVDYTNTLRERGRGRREAVLEAGPIRLRPIIMTTLAMIGGMLPTAMAISDGSELRSPMSIAVIGGLIVSTLLTLIVVPVVYTLVDDFWTKLTVSRRRKIVLEAHENGNDIHGQNSDDHDDSPIVSDR